MSGSLVDDAVRVWSLGAARCGLDAAARDKLARSARRYIVDVFGLAVGGVPSRSS
jgi:hypothetical protein